MRLPVHAAVFVAADAAPAAAQGSPKRDCSATIEGRKPLHAIIDCDNARFGASAERRRLLARWDRDLGALPR